MLEESGHSYKHDGDPTELQRLSIQADIAWDLERAHLIRLGLPASSVVVDVGCGPGLLSRRLAQLFPNGKVIGVDADSSLLDEARNATEQAGLSNVSFVRAWANQMPLAEATADLAYARFLLQHTANPVEILSEMRRVVVPGGLVVAVDTDDGGILMDPQPARLAALLEASRQGQARLGGDRHVGRKLNRYFAEAGLSDVQVAVVPFTTHLAPPDTWMRICLGFKTRTIHPATMAPEEVDAALDEIRETLHQPGAFAQSMAYLAIGRVPEPNTDRL